MAFDDVKGELAALLNELGERPEDAYELEQLVREKLNELKAFGLPLPQDLVDLEAALDAGLTAEAKERTRHDERVRK